MRKMSNSNRREWFRIDNPLAIDFRVISEQEMNEGIAVLESGGLPPGGASAMLFGMESEIDARLHILSHESPAAADALRLMNDKLNALINVLPMLAGDEPALTEEPLREGNVSASGMAFVNTTEVPAQTCLYVRVALAPNYSYVETYARVVRCEARDDPQYPFHVAIEFTYMPQTQQELLIRFTMNRQSEALRKTRSV